MYIYMYISSMSKRYSITEARTHLPGIIHKAEFGKDIEITRRGQPVAVVVSIKEYERMRKARPTFRDAYAQFLSRIPIANLGIDDDFLESLRDKDTGREVKL